MNKLLFSHDALGLAQLIQQKELTAKELLEITIVNAETINPKLNFLSHKFYDYALAQINQGLPKGLFQGVPFLLKNLGASCEKTPLSFGSQLFLNNVCSYNDEIVNRYKNAGLVLFGRSNSCEFGMSFTTEPLAYGATRNPWNLDLSPGGSSGGAAAAVAARAVAIADASDGGGSIRVPASCCGIFGLKPTRARISAGPILGESWGGFATHHVLTLSVRDSAAMLDCLAGPELGDPYFAPPQTESYLQCLERPVGKLKIGFLDSFAPSEKPDADIKLSFEKSIQLLSALGHELIPVTFPTDIATIRRAFIIIAAANVLNFIQITEKQLGKKITSNQIEPIQEKVLEFANKTTAADYANAVQTIHFHTRKIATWFESFDVLLTPTTAKTARPLGELASHSQDFNLFNAKQLAFGPYTSVANITGQPAMSVPLFWTENNIPIGSHFLGKFGDEVTLLQLAKQLEQAQPWFEKKPEKLIAH